MPHTLLAYLQQHTPRYIEELSAWATIESPTGDQAGLAEFSRQIRVRLEALGLQIEPLGTGGTRLLARHAGSEDAPILLLGHADTVYPRGTLTTQPIVQRDGRLYGPGVFDMKGGLLAMCAALEALQVLGRAPRRSLLVLVTDDEEIGSPASRPLIEQVARDAAAVLVLEPATPAGALKTARKGAGMYTLEVSGRAAHAGVAPEQGRSALVELAHQILWLQSLNNPQTGTTVSVGQAQGGSATNVIPAQASALIDVRVRTAAEGEHLAAIMAQRRAVTPDVTVAYSGGIRNPPMERTAAIVALFEHACKCAGELGFALEEAATGGGSDGNFTASLGIPTLDGLGMCGDGAHATHEHIIIDEFPRRAALLARLIETL